MFASGVATATITGLESKRQLKAAKSNSLSGIRDELDNTSESSRIEYLSMVKRVKLKLAHSH